MKILVTGGSGSVGKYVVDELQRQNHSVGVLDIVPPKPGVWFHNGNVLNLENVAKAVKGYDAVVHIAGIRHPPHHPAEHVFGVDNFGKDFSGAAPLLSYRNANELPGYEPKHSVRDILF
jgi:nucleoside-diphosphate-sugar epimerase